MSLAHQPNYLGDVILLMVDGRYNLEKINVKGRGAQSGVAHAAGDVMVTVDTTKHQKIGAADGANASAILLEPLTAAENDADIEKLAIVRGPAVVNASQLVWANETQKSQAEAALTALLILQRSEPTSSVQQT